MYWRVVESQSKLYEHDITSSVETGDALQELIEESKPKLYFCEWHDLIATPFRYPLPVGEKYAARFKKPDSLIHALYGSQQITTALYEHAYHFCRFRAGMDPKLLDKTDRRTRFSFELTSTASIHDLTRVKDWKKIMDPVNYSASWSFVDTNPTLKVIQYPSVRDPSKQPNVVVLDINECEKEIASEKGITYVFDYRDWSIHWNEDKLKIPCQELFASLFDL